jgi:Zn-dependent peptidase ImmA (M78 family)
MNELVGSVDKYKEFFAALEKASPVPVGFETIKTGAKGYHHMTENRIAINEGMSELQNLKTLIHEIAHARLHVIDAELPLKGQNLPDRRTREVEAESIAYTVCQHYGLDTADYSFGYVAGWSGGKQLDTLKSSLDTIRKEADAIIKEIDKQFAELSQDKEQAAERQPGIEEWSEPATAENAPDNPGEPSDDVGAYLPPYDGGEQSPGETKTTATYYNISEEAARRAKEANSFSDYKPGSATAAYRQSIDEAVKIAERQKAHVDPMYHTKIDGLLDTYARKLAENMNKSNIIDARVPSVRIAGPANFPVRQKEKQNAARDTNMREWQDIQGLLEKIQGTGTGGISADDPNAIDKLKSKLEGLEKSQETMKSVNAYYRKNKTLDGCQDLPTDTINKLKASMSRSWRPEPKPFESWALSNNNAEIHRTKGRIEQLTRHAVAVYVGWQINGGKVETNQQDNRLQVFFDGKPDENIRNELKSNGFRWSPNAGAWQRQLNGNALYAADRIKCLEPITGEKPTDLQRVARVEAKNAAQPPEQQPDSPELQESMQGLAEEVKATLQFFIDSDMKDHSEIRPGTLEMIAVQGYELRGGILEEAPPVNGTFTIYQLKDGDETRDYRFEPFDRLQAAGLDANMANYEPIYTAPISADTKSLGMIYEKFNIDHSEGFTGHSLSISDVIVMNIAGKETAHYVDNIGFKNLPDFLTPKEQTNELPTPEPSTPAFDLKTVADYMQKQHDTIQAADPNKTQGQAAFSMAVKRLEQATGRIPDEHPQLKALLTHAAQSPDLATLKERMSTMQNEFTQHYSTVVQMSIDTSGKAEPPTPTASIRQNNDPAPVTKLPAQGENVAAIEAKVKAGEVINLTDLSDAIQKDKQAAAHKTQTGKPSQQTPTKKENWKAAQKQDAWDRAQGKGASKPAPEKPSIREELAAGKKQLAAQKSAPSRAQTKTAEIGG